MDIDNKMVRVCIKKIAESPNPWVNAAKWEEFIAGENNPGVSLPVEYELKGELVNKIEQGFPIEVKRDERNGVKVDGFFASSPVRAIGKGMQEEKNVWYVETKNSLYKIIYE